MYKRLFGTDPPDWISEYTDEQLVKVSITKRKLDGQRVVCNMTTIPPRFQNIQDRVNALKKHLIFDEIVIHVPKRYGRFPGAHTLEIKGATVNYVDEDYGPGTRILHGKGDIIVYCDDDTDYSHELSTRIVERVVTTGKCWTGSGFNFSTYFMGDFSKCDGMQVQVVEGYGMVAIKKEWVDQVRDDFIRLHECTYNDDMILSNLLEKIGIDKYVCVVNGGISQLTYGFDENALHFNNGDKSHVSNNKTILKNFRSLGQMYFKPVVSFITEGDVERLVDNIIHADEIISTGEAKVPEEYRPFVKENQSPRGTYTFRLHVGEVPSTKLISVIHSIASHGADVVNIPVMNSEGTIDMQPRFFKTEMRGHRTISVHPVPELAIKFCGI